VDELTNGYLFATLCSYCACVAKNVKYGLLSQYKISIRSLIHGGRLLPTTPWPSFRGLETADIRLGLL
jgi:hypothetical protein